MNSVVMITLSPVYQVYESLEAKSIASLLKKKKKVKKKYFITFCFSGAG